MKWIATLLVGFPVLRAQYRLIGEQTEPLKKVHLHATILLSPTFIRIQSVGRWDSMEADFHFLFNSQGVFWLDEKQRVAYDITPESRDTLAFWAEEPKAIEYEGRRALHTFIRFVTKKMEVAWDTSVAFDWTPWFYRLPAEGLGTPARYFGKGVPVYWRLYDEKGRVENEFRLKHIEPFTPSPQEGRLTYPVQKLKIEPIR